MLNNGAVALIIRVSDRFGEHGIVGLSIALVEPGKNLRWRIDTFLLSCRVMGRGIENALLSVTIDQIKGRGAVDKVIGEYIETKKNLPAKDFYEKQGFKRIESSNGLHFEFDPNTQVIDAPNYFQIEVN
jgi:FkbH-like protein